MLSVPFAKLTKIVITDDFYWPPWLTANWKTAWALKMKIGNKIAW
jgi:hypothetical protein